MTMTTQNDGDDLNEDRGRLLNIRYHRNQHNDRDNKIDIV